MFYSQFGEDRILAKIFAGRERGVCVEVGANNGVDGSTTLHFEEVGWDCVLVEPNPDLCRALRIRRRARIFECAASSFTGVATLQIAFGAPLADGVSTLGGADEAKRLLRQFGFQTREVEVKTRTLDSILEEAGIVGQIDFISIDVEGHEVELLKGFSPDRWRPTIIIVEDNSWTASVCGQLREAGYVRINRTGVNDWYVHETNSLLGGWFSRVAYYPAMWRARGRMFAGAAGASVSRALGQVAILRRLRCMLLGSRNPPL
jgi:FkbM family methyltransferase